MYYISYYNIITCNFCICGTWSWESPGRGNYGEAYERPEFRSAPGSWPDLGHVDQGLVSTPEYDYHAVSLELLACRNANSSCSLAASSSFPARKRRRAVRPIARKVSGCWGPSSFRSCSTFPPTNSRIPLSLAKPSASLSVALIFFTHHPITKCSDWTGMLCNH